MKIEFQVKGMTCGSCEAKISEAVRRVSGVSQAKASKTTGRLTIESDHNLSLEEVQRAVSGAGNYTVSTVEAEGAEWANYRPLAVVVGYIVGATVLLSLGDGHTSFHDVMRYFMGSFFILFSLFKLLDLNGFADGFSTYDVIARRSRGYALSYPFIELALGIAYLMDFAPAWTNLATFIVMGVSLVGVVGSLLRGSQFQCACLGTVLKVPLSKVTFVEDAAMALMAGIGLLAL